MSIIMVEGCLLVLGAVRVISIMREGMVGGMLPRLSRGIISLHMEHRHLSRVIIRAITVVGRRLYGIFMVMYDYLLFRMMIQLFEVH